MVSPSILLQQVHTQLVFCSCCLVLHLGVAPAHTQKLTFIVATDLRQTLLSSYK